MLKKLVLFVAAVMLLASSAQAALNDIYPFTDSPDIVKGVCSRAGALTLTFDNSTVFNSIMPVITGRLTDGVTLCKPVDLYVRVPNAAALTSSVDGPIRGQYSAYSLGWWRCRDSCDRCSWQTRAHYLGFEWHAGI